MYIKLQSMFMDMCICTYTYKTYLKFHFVFGLCVYHTFAFFVIEVLLSGVLSCFIFSQLKKNLKLDRRQWGNSKAQQTELDRINP